MSRYCVSRDCLALLDGFIASPPAVQGCEDLSEDCAAMGAEGKGRNVREENAIGMFQRGKKTEGKWKRDNKYKHICISKLNSSIQLECYFDTAEEQHT